MKFFYFNVLVIIIFVIPLFFCKKQEQELFFGSTPYEAAYNMSTKYSLSVYPKFNIAYAYDENIHSNGIKRTNKRIYDKKLLESPVGYVLIETINIDNGVYEAIIVKKDDKKTKLCNLNRDNDTEECGGLHEYLCTEKLNIGFYSIKYAIEPCSSLNFPE